MENKSYWSDWRLTELIGEGSFSKVYRAEKRIGQTTDRCAIKIISVPKRRGDIDELTLDGLGNDDIKDFLYSIVLNFVREIELMIKFRGCENIVIIHDYAIAEKERETGWDIYIRMEELVPLDRYFASHTPDEQAIARLGSDLCNALSAFEKNVPAVIRRDIKPSNIFVSEYGVFKLGDFGAAREAEKTYGCYTQIGTLSYMSPETKSSGQYTRASDIYSLGLVMYKLANNNMPPFVSGKIADMNVKNEAMNRRFSGDELPPPNGVSETFGQIILKACAYKTKNRFQSADELSASLNSMLRNNEMTRAKKGTVKALAVVAGALVLLIAAAVTGAIMNNQAPEALVAVSENTVSAESAGGQYSVPAEALQHSDASDTAKPESDTAGTTSDISKANIGATDTYTAREETAAALITTEAMTTETTVKPANRQITTTATATTTTTAKATTTKPEASTKTANDNIQQEKNNSDFTYLIDDNGVVILGYKGTGTKVVIPREIEGRKVYSIGNSSFSESKITSIVIPEGVTTIGCQAFWFAQNLKSVSLPNSLSVIRGNSFYGCQGLKSLDIPCNVTVIEALCFGWSGLSAINVDKDNPNFSSIDGVLYDKKATHLLYYPAYKTDEEYKTPDTLVGIIDYAFDRTKYLRKLYISKQLVSFNQYQLLSSVTSIEAEDGGVFCSIDGVLFSYDKKTLLFYPSGREESIYIVPDGTRLIKAYSFADCKFLSTITIPSEVVVDSSAFFESTISIQ